MFYGYTILTVIEYGLYSGESCSYRRAFRTDKIVQFFNGCIVIADDGKCEGEHIRVKENFDEIREAMMASFVVPQFKIIQFPED